MKSKFYGYNIQYENGEWLFSDTLEPTESTYSSRPCGKCGLYKDEDDHDPCINNLPYVSNACCGHGEVKDCYVQFINGDCYYEDNAKSLIEWLKKEKIEKQTFRPIEVCRVIKSKRKMRGCDENN